jgi:peptidoglycan-associated lipoprotein
MTTNPRLRLLGLVALVVAVAVSGCSKKQAAPPPAVEPPPAAEQPATPPPAPETPAETPAPEPVALSWQDAFFDYDSADLRDEARAALDADARLLRDRPEVRVVIEGHCDERGTAEYNLALGERRAAAARDYLVAAGIDGGRLEIVSFGKERPFDPGHDEAAWAQNRRAHIVTK